MPPAPFNDNTPGVPYNTFDGPGFPACNQVSQVHLPMTVDGIVALVKDASLAGTPVRASGVRRFFVIAGSLVSDYLQ